MYYTRLLKHSDIETNKLEDSPVPESPYLDQIVPFFFNRLVGDGYVHVLIVCSDSKDTNWKDGEFQAKFCVIDNQVPELLSSTWERDKRSKRLCVHIDKDLHAIPDALKEVLKAVTACYEDVNILGCPLEDFLNLFEICDPRSASYCHKTLISGIDNAIKKLDCRRTLFVRIILPEKCFEEFQTRYTYIPPFIEYVVLGQLQDSKTQELQNEVRKLKEEIAQKNNSINSLEREKDRLRSEFSKKKSVPVSEYNKMLEEYNKMLDYYQNKIKELMKEIELLNKKLTEISEIIEPVRTKQKMKT